MCGGAGGRGGGLEKISSMEVGIFSGTAQWFMQFIEPLMVRVIILF